MLLNSFAQPILLSSGKEYLNGAELKESPLLLCHKNALNGKMLPADWSGCIYATREILKEVDQDKYAIKPSATQLLYPNEIYTINTINDDTCRYKSKSLEITALPWDEENTVYLIKDEIVTNLLTDVITENLTIFIQNEILRNSIKNGIDVLYVNDGVYHKSPELKDFPSEYLLGALVTLVKPRYVKGLLSEEQLPQHITGCCQDISVA